MSSRPRDSGARHEPPRRPPLARPRHVLELLVLVLVLALALLGFVGNVSAQTPTVTVQFEEASYEVNEGDTLTVTVEVSGTVPPGGFTVYAMDTAIGATGMGVDYVSGPFELAFTAGDSNPTATFPLVTIGDSESDDAENFAIVLSDYGLPNGIGLGTRFTTEVTINNVADADVCAPNLPSDAVTFSEITAWRDALNNDAGIKRFNRVLATLGVETGENPMAADQAQQVADWLGNTRWDRIARTLAAMELSECDTPPPTEPELSIAAGADITEGGDATFTVTATPSPSADLDVTVEVSQSGDYASTGSQTVTIPSTGSQTLTVTTTNDANDEPDGSVTGTISAGTGYTVSSSASAATVAVSDDDVPEISITAGTTITEGGDATFAVTASPTPSADLDVTVEVSQSGDYASTGSQTVTIPSTGSQTLTVTTTNDSTDEADGSVTAAISAGTGYTVSSSASAATVAVSDDDAPSLPEISIAADGDVTEGTDASYTLTATPKPAANIDVSVEVTQSGDFVTTGSQTVTITTSGTATFTVPTTNDGTSEADGSVTATISVGTDHTVSTNAASATVAVSDDDDAQLASQAIIDSCVSNSVLTTVRRYYDANKDRAPNYGRNWKRVLVTFRDVEDSQLTPFTAAKALAGEQQWFGWKPVREALECIEAATTPPPPSDPELSIAAGSAITEGSDVTFTVTATPAPTSALTVSLTVSQNGSFGATTGTDTVTIPTTGSATFTVNTTNDNTDEPDGSVTATLSTGTGYTVPGTSNAATVSVLDDDAPPATPVISIAAGSGVTEGSDATFTLAASPAPTTALTISVAISQSGGYVTSGTRSVTIPTSGTKTFAVTTTDDSDDEADGSVTATLSSGTGYTVLSSASTATVAVSDDDDAQLALQVIIDSCVSESLLATVRRYYDANKDRAPSYGRNWKRVLITFRDVQDSQLTPFTAAEALAGEQVWFGWKPVREALECIEEATAPPPPPPPPPPPSDPEISISAGTAVTEGTDATFTVTATPAPTTALTVNLAVSQSGNFGATTGADTMIIPTTGSATYTVSTTNDGTDEPDGSVTATLSTGSGYTLSGTNNSATVAVSDDDDPPAVTPTISIAAGSSITEGSDATFTVTASPTPTTTLTVNLTVSQSGNFGATTGTDTVTIPTSGSATFTVSTTNDNTDEPGGSVTATLSTGSGYIVSRSNNAATVAVSDDDDPPAATPTISIAAGSGITEGSNASFTVTASPNPTSALTVNVTISQSGNFGATTGSRTITVPTSGSLTFTVSTTNDNTDEANGSVSATLTTGTGYSVSTNGSTATVAVSDDDPAPGGRPTVTVSDASGSEGDGHVTFTVTLSHANPKAIKFRYGGFGRTASVGPDFYLEYIEFTLNAGDTTLDIDVPVIDDNAVEGDETITIYVYATSGITIPDYFVYADGTIIDDDS